jgi:hypothetical protein
MCLSLKEVAVHAGHKGLMDIDGASALIVSNPRGILDQHLMARPIHLINIIIIIVLINGI